MFARKACLGWCLALGVASWEMQGVRGRLCIDIYFDVY